MNKQKSNASPVKVDAAGDVFIALRLAERCHARQDYSTAKDVALSIISADRKHLPALELLARVQWSQGSLNELLSTLDQMIALNPYEPGYHSLKGAALQSLDRVGDAIRAFERSIAISTVLDAQSAATLEELYRFQEVLIHALCESNETFKISYQRDPMAACEKYGFALQKKAVASAGPHLERSRLSLSARPS